MGSGGPKLDKSNENSKYIFHRITINLIYTIVDYMFAYETKGLLENVKDK